MAMDREAAIRERAYHLWVEGGRRDGADEQDWLRAEREHDAPPARGARKPAAARKAGGATAAAERPGRARAADGRFAAARA